jgi:predicted lipoprotein with Yx(FWY)xxD motif
MVWMLRGALPPWQMAEDVTYNKVPLYYWAKDTKAGETTGQGVGSVWFVVAPDGKVIGNEAPASSSSSSSEAALSVVDDAKLGKILVGANGMTLYMFTKDEPDKSNCTGDCLTKWPPADASGPLGDGVMLPGGYCPQTVRKSHLQPYASVLLVQGYQGR